MLCSLCRSSNENFVDQAQQRVPWDLEGVHERVLTAPWDPDYTALLQAARDRASDSDISDFFELGDSRLPVQRSICADVISGGHHEDPRCLCDVLPTIGYASTTKLVNLALRVERDRMSIIAVSARLYTDASRTCAAHPVEVEPRRVFDSTTSLGAALLSGECATFSGFRALAKFVRLRAVGACARSERRERTQKWVTHWI